MGSSSAASVRFVLAAFITRWRWTIAKKMIEEGHFAASGLTAKSDGRGRYGGRPLQGHVSGPSLNILIKLMSMVAIVMAGLTVACHLF